MAGVAFRLGTMAVQRAMPYIMRALPPVLGGTGGVIVGDEVSKELEKRRAEADEAKTSPVAKAQTQTQTKEKCDDCPAAAGVPVPKHFRKHKTWMDYQTRVTGMPGGPNFVTDWRYNNVEFDGFRASECLLIEAKAAYDQFFIAPGTFRYRFQRFIMLAMERKAARQAGAALPSPPIQLRWYFMEPMTYEYMRPRILRVSPSIQVVYQP